MFSYSLRYLMGGLVTMLLSLVTAVQAARPMTVTGSFDHPPYAFREAAGELTGFEVDLLRVAARQAGLAIKFSPGDWLDQREGDIHLASAVEVGSIEQLFTRTIGTRSHLVFVPVGSLVRGLEDLRASGENVAVVGGSGAGSYLHKLGVASQQAAADARSAMIAVLEGEAAAVVLDEYEGTALARELGGIEARGEPFLAREVAFAVADESVRKKLDEGLRVVAKSGELERLEKRWLEPLAARPVRAHMLLAYGQWVVLPLVLLIVAALAHASGQKRRAARRIVTLERELAAERRKAEDLEQERAVQQYVMNQLSTVTLVDQLIDVSQSRDDY